MYLHVDPRDMTSLVFMNCIKWYNNSIGKCNSDCMSPSGIIPESIGEGSGEVWVASEVWVESDVTIEGGLLVTTCWLLGDDDCEGLVFELDDWLDDWLNDCNELPKGNFIGNFIRLLVLKSR